MHPLFMRFLLLLLLSGHSLAQGQGPQIIPFRLTNDNNLVLQAVVNDKDSIAVMLHTAASGLTLTEEAVSRLKNLHFDGSDDNVTSWSGPANSARYSKNNRLSIGGLHWDSIMVWEDMQSGPGTDGKIGLDLFAGKVVELDFDKGVLILYDTLPAGINDYDKLALRRQGDMLFLEADFYNGRQSFHNALLIHSGYSGALLLDDAFVTTSNIGPPLKVVSEQKLTDAYGKTLKVKKAILPGLTIGRQQLGQVPAGFFEGAIGRQKMSVLGGDILKRFHVIIDAGRTSVYLKPGALINAPYKG
ncbi:hypothetical protein [Taibaiella koreensis]|uniref:hypothetical protein n=1 Tax=Taibaiella koreensis TaxID=1268548 RepID=UPI001968F932|nr:hypothetical protein [Taibaiella koreensis]